MVGYCTLICKPVFNKKNSSWRFYVCEYIPYPFHGKHFKNCNLLWPVLLKKKQRKTIFYVKIFSIKAYLWFHIIFKTIWLIESVFFTSLFLCRKRTLKSLILQLYFSDRQYMTSINIYPPISYLNLILSKCFRFILSYLKPPVYCNRYHNTQSCFLAN